MVLAQDAVAAEGRSCSQIRARSLQQAAQSRIELNLPGRGKTQWLVFCASTAEPQRAGRRLSSEVQQLLAPEAPLAVPADGPLSQTAGRAGQRAVARGTDVMSGRTSMQRRGKPVNGRTSPGRCGPEQRVSFAGGRRWCLLWKKRFWRWKKKVVESKDGGVWDPGVVVVVVAVSQAGRQAGRLPVRQSLHGAAAVGSSRVVWFFRARKERFGFEGGGRGPGGRGVGMSGRPRGSTARCACVRMWRRRMRRRMRGRGGGGGGGGLGWVGLLGCWAGLLLGWVRSTTQRSTAQPGGGGDGGAGGCGE